MKNTFKIICFDADDTLWVNEPYYRGAENEFYKLMAEFKSNDLIEKELYKTEVSNMSLYGYGAKSFTLSMVETALRLSDYKIPQEKIADIVQLGKNLINSPLVLLDGVIEVLEFFYENQKRLIVATKGDLLDQERKLKKSGLEKYFHHIEIMSEKEESDYEKLLRHLDCQPHEFMMIGNSLKSDILPIVHIGGHAVHVPCEMTWQHETVPEEALHDKHFHSVEHIKEVIHLFD